MSKPLRFIHTADWHLGQTLLGQSRAEEQQLALEWILEQVDEHQVDGLIVAGDIFDVASPAEDARKMYYDCLASLAKSSLKWIVIIAGNHDSPRMISNIDALAKAFNIYIVATPAAADEIRKDVIQIRDPKTKELQGLIAAVPFLLDRYVRRSRAGEAVADKEEALAAGIHQHFERLAQACQEIDEQVPAIATGHLFATGAEARAGQDNIYVGNIRNLSATDLPERFDYVALGHIHRPQDLKGANHVRYSGSLIPLDFQEGTDIKGIWIVEVVAGSEPVIQWSPSPVSRRLKQLSGTLEDVREKLTAFCARHKEDELSPWIDIALIGETVGESDRAELRSIAEKSNARVLKITRRRESSTSEKGELIVEDLADLSVEEVFDRRCAAADLAPETRALIDPLFIEALADARAGKVDTEA